MAVSMSPKQKVYQGVLQEIRRFIDSNDLEPGDKLPSERDLSEKLHAGRSSVREALRAMELLGLIQTRHGEGTFLSMYNPYQTVELLSSFILQENNTKKDLLATKRLIEKEVAKLACKRLNTNDLYILQSYLDNPQLSRTEMHVSFFRFLSEHAENKLLAKIWYLLDDFSNTVNTFYFQWEFYHKLLEMLRQKECELIDRLFMDQHIHTLSGGDKN
ncbi:FadR/GntR family transcriptional regulator [Virgibacillus siamensis]|uniref:FadR/GntR family transcriptional regulator n=1 Tax=Virgibacillus siamensis TaxID=480071 RepID=UPI0011157AF4|nr:GntR family transcriptional regulator [Virgibacillus siamensis]